VTALAIVALLLAAGPAVLSWRNFRIFHPPVSETGPAVDVAILIPARNEARNIAAAVAAALGNPGAEVIVLDDLSDDGTDEIVAEIGAREPRVFLVRGKPLPTGWCGKNWACAQLARAATRPLLLFVDADVRLKPDAAGSIANWLRESGAQLASGIPRQELGTFSERLLIPLIHFVLLGFLPLKRMRESQHPAYATGCGQLVVADAEAYRKAGGHEAVRARIHDGLALPKVFREAGLRTDLFDATEFATCRMYRSDTETWRGFGKNTHEGLGAPARIVPATLILLLGQVMPFALLVAAPWLTTLQLTCALAACALALFSRLLAAKRFHQPLMMIVLHPVAIFALLAIQWIGLVRYLCGKSAEWKGRRQPCSHVPAGRAGVASDNRLAPARPTGHVATNPLAGNRVPAADA